MAGRRDCHRARRSHGRISQNKQFFSQGVIANGVKLWYTFDQLGSVRELIDSTGAIRSDYRYDTYGKRTKESGDLDSDFGYAGLFHHGPSGLDLATYRTYDSAQGRWISRDPLGEGVDYNLYRYCGNSPIARSDSSGLDDSLANMQNGQNAGVPNPGLTNPWNATDTQSINDAINVVRLVDQGKALQLESLLLAGRIRPLNPAVTGLAEGFTPGDGIFLDVRTVRCGDKVKLASLLVHELGHIGQEDKTASIIMYIFTITGGDSKNLEIGPYADQLSTLLKLRGSFSTGSPERISLEAQITKVSGRLQNLNTLGHI